MSRARALVDDLARRSREAGTPAAAAARDATAALLRDVGFEVESLPFRFAPSALTAVPIAGAGLGLLALLQFPLLVLPAWGKAALLAWLVGAAALATLALGVGLGWTTLGAPLREDANLVARRPGGEVRLWLVAHLDTKAQVQSMAGRLVAVWLSGAAALLLTGLALARVLGPVPLWLAALGTVSGVAGGALLSRGRLRGGSPGARDNASGLLTVLTVAERSATAELGILVTGAEEFGLVGARVLAQERPELFTGCEVVNVDTVDDRGPVYLVSHEKKGGALAEHLEPVVRHAGAEVRRRRLPAGIMVDSLPLAPIAARAVTLARLDCATLRLVHTAADTADGLGFATAERLGGLLADAIDPARRAH
ncbi:MAG: M28 family metallopeptidase [Gemmatimonadales bacterium]|nr:M28 family metallopeptidase [Gemmatimonadales bacterium]